MDMKISSLALMLLLGGVPVAGSARESSVELYPLSEVRIMGGPFAAAAEFNRDYLLRHDPDRLLSPFLREAGLKPKADSYGNWERTGLDGHTAGHYLSALAMMVASGVDADGELGRRLDYMLDELGRCQEAFGDGYIGGVPGSRAMWKEVASGNIRAHIFELNDKWVPLYNIHKTYAGLRDAYVIAERDKARGLLVKFGDWCVNLLSGLDDRQVQDMLRSEHGGMNEVMADIHVITGEKKYLEAARRLNHRAVLDPLVRKEDRLTGLHANTQIPKVIGLERIAALTNDEQAHGGAEFFWNIVTRDRSAAFGGNSVREHFHPKEDFRSLVEDRQGPETCNTYNMLRLTEQLFAVDPKAAFADFYERALYNHILASIHPSHEESGYVYFTPLRPQHYRVYSKAEEAFWCCVGSGMENPGKYGQFIYARDKQGVYVNLFVPSELKIAEGMRLKQETTFPMEPTTRLVLKLAKPQTFSLNLRHPSWVGEGAFAVTVNGKLEDGSSTSSSYREIRREWQDGDVVEVSLPMQASVERLPDGSNWASILYGPIVLAAPSGTEKVTGLVADDGRMGHIAHGPLVPLDEVPVLVIDEEKVGEHVVPDPAAGPMRFRLVNATDPAPEGGFPLQPFFRTHDERYQIYWLLTSEEERSAMREGLAAEEKARAEREAATLDQVGIGEQQPEVEHDFAGEDTETGTHEGRRWRHGHSFQYTLNTRGEKAVELEVTYWGGDAGRTFEILADGTRIATVELTAEKPGEFFQKRYPIPSGVLNAAEDHKVTIKFQARSGLAGGVYDVRLMKRGE